MRVRSAVAAGGRPDRLSEHLGPRILQQEPGGTGPERAVHVLVEVEGRDHHDRDGFSTVGPASSRVASTPSRTGIRMSIRQTSGRSSRASRTASCPSRASPTTSMPSGVEDQP